MCQYKLKIVVAKKNQFYWNVFLLPWIYNCFLKFCCRTNNVSLTASMLSCRSIRNTQLSGTRLLLYCGVPLQSSGQHRVVSDLCGRQHVGWHFCVLEKCYAGPAPTTLGLNAIMETLKCGDTTLSWPSVRSRSGNKLHHLRWELHNVWSLTIAAFLMRCRGRIFHCCVMWLHILGPLEHFAINA